MPKKNPWMPVLAILLVLTMVLSACGGAEPTATPIPPQPTEAPTVEPTVEPTETPEPTAVPEPTQEPEPVSELDLGAAIADYFARVPEGWGVVKVAALSEQLAEEAPLIVDVRQPEEYAEGFVEGAINIPLRELAQHLDAMPDLDQDIVVYCKSGFRSAIGMAALQILGYDNARSLAGGYLAWSAELPTVTEPVPALPAGESPAIDDELVAAMDDYLVNVLPEGWGVITTEGLLESLVEEPPFMLDVRQPEEYEAGAIDGALNIPLRELGAHMDQLPTDQPIVAICGSGHRSTIAMIGLQMLGYEVNSLVGGMQAYNASMSPAFDVAAVVADYYATIPEGWGVIKVEALNEQLAEEPPLIVDVRQPEEYADGLIEGAVNIPLRELAQHLDAMPELDRDIVVYCKSGFRSAIGMTVLQILGYENAKSLAGGYLAWSAELPTVTEPAPELPAGDLPTIDAELIAEVDGYLTNVLPEGWGVVTSEGLMEALVEDPPFLLDVRQPEEFAAGHIEGAINIPLRELGDKMDMMNMVPRDAAIAVICGSGHRSTMAMVGMQLAGFVNATSLVGGMNGYGGEVVSGFDLEAAMDAYLTNLPEGWGVIKVEALNEQLAEEPPLIVDVRQPEEYADGFIEGAINIPLRELAQHLEAMPDLDQDIVVYCKSGFRSALAMTTLQVLGYENAKSLAGGYLAWSAELPTVTEPVPALPAGDLPAIDAQLLATVDDYLVNVLPEGWGVMSVEGLNEQMVEEPPFILDVRQPEEYADGHIEGAINIPLRELGQNLAQLPADGPVVVVCGSGHRSTIGMEVLQMLGFEDVTSMAGGVQAWTAAELSLVTE